MANSAISEAHATTATTARCALVEELQNGLLQSGHELHEGVDRPSHDPPTPLHPLDRRHREPRPLGQRALVDSQEGPSRFELARSNQG